MLGSSNVILSFFTKKKNIISHFSTEFAGSCLFFFFFSSYSCFFVLFFFSTCFLSVFFFFFFFEIAGENGFTKGYNNGTYKISIKLRPPESSSLYKNLEKKLKKKKKKRTSRRLMPSGTSSEIPRRRTFSRLPLNV